jgi:hypothetical protein
LAPRTTKDNKLAVVKRCIRETAREAAQDGLSTSVIERFLYTGESTWDGVGSGCFDSAQFKGDKAFSRAVETAIAGPVLSVG